MQNALIAIANVMMVVTSLFLICLVLIQRGKGGGLAGAFGGAGGSSAFGTKAGDVFTRVTIYVASFWFLLALFLVYTSDSGKTTAFNKGLTPDSATSADSAEGDAADKSKNKNKGKEKDLTPLDVPAVEKAPAGSKPTVTPTTPAVPLNPAKEGAEATSSKPATPVKKP